MKARRRSSRCCVVCCALPTPRLLLHWRFTTFDTINFSQSQTLRPSFFCSSLCSSHCCTKIFNFLRSWVFYEDRKLFTLQVTFSLFLLLCSVHVVHVQQRPARDFYFSGGLACVAQATDDDVEVFRKHRWEEEHAAHPEYYVVVVIAHVGKMSYNANVP